MQVLYLLHLPTLATTLTCFLSRMQDHQHFIGNALGLLSFAPLQRLSFEHCLLGSQVGPPSCMQSENPSALTGLHPPQPSSLHVPVRRSLVTWVASVLDAGAAGAAGDDGHQAIAPWVPGALPRVGHSGASPGQPALASGPGGDPSCQHLIAIDCFERGRWVDI